nr:P-loop NTPase fold protein [uncultured Actinoplanes sp.]
MVDGPWGSGKTTVMHLLRKRLEDAAAGWVEPGRKRHHLTTLGASRLLAKLHRADDQDSDRASTPAGPPGPPVAALFEPWAHQTSEQLWAGLARTITEAAVPTFCAGADARGRFWFDRNARRLDVAHLRRQLARNVTSPFLRLAVFALSVPVVVQLMRQEKPAELWGIAATQWAWIIPAVLLLIGLGHTAGRLLFGRAVSFLPAELFTGPVLSRAMASPSRDAPLRDPLNNAQSRYLYLVQRDVKTILEELAKRRRSLVIFVDDLDRCDSRSAVEVMQALNLFLTGALQGCRLVIGLDQVIAAAQLDEIYQHIDKSAFTRFGDDPSPGWTFLRKLTHLPIIMPIVGDTSVDLYLSGLLGFPYGDVVGTGSATVLLAGQDRTRVVERSDEVVLPEMRAEVERALEARTSHRRIGRGRWAGTLATMTRPLRRSFLPETGPRLPVPPAPPIEDVDIVALERHQDVRNAIRKTIAGHDDPSGRETKRLLNIWQFYLRLLLRTTPVVTLADGIDMAVHLVTVADILNRWPATARQLTTVVDGRLGLALLCESADEHLPWERALIATRLDAIPYEKAVRKMRSVLLAADRKAVAAVATELFLRDGA